jgi:hypothetical protein
MNYTNELNNDIIENTKFIHVLLTGICVSVSISILLRIYNIKID